MLLGPKGYERTMLAERLKQLSSVPLFRGLSDEELMPLAEVAAQTT